MMTVRVLQWTKVLSSPGRLDAVNCAMWGKGGGGGEDERRARGTAA